MAYREPSKTYPSQVLPNLRFEIRRQNMVQAHIARALGLADGSSLTTWCSGLAPVPGSVIEPLADILHISPDVLGAKPYPGVQEQADEVQTYQAAGEAWRIETEDARPTVNLDEPTNGQETVDAALALSQAFASPTPPRRVAISMGMDGMPMGPWPARLVRCSCGIVLRRGVGN